MAESKRDYYEVLGVSKDADEATLKKAQIGHECTVGNSVALHFHGAYGSLPDAVAEYFGHAP